jgi:methylmalonyl-CoA mutase
MNAIDHPNVYMRSLATRDAGSEISQALPDVIAACKVAGFDLIVVETSGIGQGDAAIVPLVDSTLYVMTPEFGAASQLEKIDMLDFADFVAINKFDRKGAQDALRDVAKQYQRNREQWMRRPDEMPVFGTQASRFNDDGVTALYQGMLPRLVELGLEVAPGRLPKVDARHSSSQIVIVPPARVRYLADIADTVRSYKARARAQARWPARSSSCARVAADAAAGRTRQAPRGRRAGGAGAARETRSTRPLGKLLAMWPTCRRPTAVTSTW